MKVGDIVKLPDGKYLEKTYSGKASVEDLTILAKALHDENEKLVKE